MRARSIAAAQTIPLRGDVAANVENHIRLVDAAAAECTQVLVFPELSLTGYELDLADDLSFAPNDPRLNPLVDLASSCSMTLVVGAPVRLASRLHIGAFILRPDTSVGLYTKHHLGTFSGGAEVDGTVPAAEATVFHPGNRDPLVRFGDNTAAIAVCADTSRPAHLLEAANRGARTYLASMFVIPSALEKETEILRQYALQHSMAVVFANYGGPSGGLASGGKSAVWSDEGELLAQLEPLGAGVVVATESDTAWHAKTIMINDR